MSGSVDVDAAFVRIIYDLYQSTVCNPAISCGGIFQDHDFAWVTLCDALADLQCLNLSQLFRYLGQNSLGHVLVCFKLDGCVLRVIDFSKISADSFADLLVYLTEISVADSEIFFSRFVSAFDNIDWERSSHRLVRCEHRCRIDWLAVFAYLEMEVRTRSASGGTGIADQLSAVHLSADLLIRMVAIRDKIIGVVYRHHTTFYLQMRHNLDLGKMSIPCLDAVRVVQYKHEAVAVVACDG